MRLITGWLLITAFLISCSNHDKIPDVSDIKIGLQTQRFEKDMFTLDSANFTAELDQLQAKYPSFGENFIYTVLRADPAWPEDSVSAYVRKFTSLYRHIYDSSQLIFKDFTPYENDIKKGLQYVKYYFPDYNVPKKIITFLKLSIF